MRGGKNRLSGFTIVELLLATAIFSTVLMVVIAGFLQIGRLFYKGITLTNTQQVARQVVDNVSNDIRYNPAFAPDTPLDGDGGNMGYYCVGNVRYTYHIGHLVTNEPKYLTTDRTDFGLLRDTLSGATGCDNPFTQTGFSEKTKELLSTNMRLKRFDIGTLRGQVYQINIDLVAGSDDSLTFEAGIPSCDSSLKQSQYCAEASLSTSVSVNTGALNTDNFRENGVIVKKGGTGFGTVTSAISNDSGDNVGVNQAGLDNLECGEICQVVYHDPLTIKMTATPRADSVFDKWSFAKSDKGCIATSAVPSGQKPNNVSPCKLKVLGGIYVTAIFKCKKGDKQCDYTLNVGKTGDGQGSVTSDKKLNCGSQCTETYEQVTTVKLTAKEADNSTFRRWSNSNCAEGQTSKTCTIKVERATDVNARFDCKNPTCAWDITIEKKGNGRGTVQSTPDPGATTRKIDCGDICSTSFDQQTNISLTAIPDDRSTFSGWEDSCVGGTKTSNPCTVTVDESITWGANFKKK